MGEVTVRSLGLISFIEPGATKRLVLRDLSRAATRWFDIAPLVGLHRNAKFTVSVSYNTNADDKVSATVAVTNSGPDQSGSVEVIMMRTAI